MNIVFFGSPDFAVPAFKAIQSSSHNILAVVSQPDKPRGRKLNVSPTPIKELALLNSIKALTPSSLNDDTFKTEYENLNPDVNIVVAYGKIMPQWLIDYPKHGSFNAHASLLPRWRGAAPIRQALISGDKETGVTIQKVVFELDAGDVVLSEALGINPEDNNQSLNEKLSSLSAKLLVKVLDLTKIGNLPMIKQDEDLVTFAEKITKEEQVINLNNSNLEVFNKIRAFTPKPGAYIIFKRKRLKLLGAEIINSTNDCCKVIEIRKEGIVIGVGSGSLLLKTVQFEGSREMSAFEFAKGQRINIGDMLSEYNGSGRRL